MLGLVFEPVVIPPFIPVLMFDRGEPFGLEEAHELADQWIIQTGRVTFGREFLWPNVADSRGLIVGRLLPGIDVVGRSHRIRLFVPNRTIKCPCPPDKMVDSAFANGKKASA